MKTKKYAHLNLYEREQLAILKAQGKSLREIGKVLGRSHTTLSRDMKKNSMLVHRKLEYIPVGAYLTATNRRHFCVKSRSLKTPFIKAYVDERIQWGWSPEQVSGRLKLDHPGLSISHEAIYLYIYKKNKKLIPFLPCQHNWRVRKYHKRHRLNSRIPKRVSISERPPEINQKLELGHWESDSMCSRASKVSLHVLLERKSRITLISKVEQNTALDVRRSIKRRLSKLPKPVRKSITYDNGPENSDHLEVNRRLGTKSYFCNPCHSWEKGAIEHTNRLIRRFIPKKTDLKTISEETLKTIEKSLNTRPRCRISSMGPGQFPMMGAG